MNNIEDLLNLTGLQLNQRKCEDCNCELSTIDIGSKCMSCLITPPPSQFLGIENQINQNRVLSYESEFVVSNLNPVDFSSSQVASQSYYSLHGSMNWVSSNPPIESMKDLLSVPINILNDYEKYDSPICNFITSANSELYGEDVRVQELGILTDIHTIKNKYWTSLILKQIQDTIFLITIFLIYHIFSTLFGGNRDLPIINHFETIKMSFFF